MGLLDVLIVLIVVVAIFFGYAKGVIVQLGSVLGIIAGIVACRLFGGYFTNMFAGDNPSANDLYVCGVFSNLVIFLLAFFGAWLLARMVKVVSHAFHLSPIDRILGAAFCAFEWLFVFSLLLNVWQSFNTNVHVASYSKFADGRPAEVVMDIAPKVLGSKAASDLYHGIESIGK